MHNSDSPIISVITTTLNAEKNIEPTILSVETNRCKNIEYIVIDGGSKDRTLDILKKYNKTITHWESGEDDGIYDAMNRASRIAKGRWLLFLGAGDLLIHSLEDISKLLVDENCVYYGDAYFPSRHQIYQGKISNINLLFNNICHQTIFYPKRLFDHYQFNSKYRVLADHALNIESFFDKIFEFKYIKVLICIYEDRVGFSKRNKDLVFEKDRIIYAQKYLSYMELMVFSIRLFLHKSKEVFKGLMNANN